MDAAGDAALVPDTESMEASDAGNDDSTRIAASGAADTTAASETAPSGDAGFDVAPDAPTFASMSEVERYVEALEAVPSATSSPAGLVACAESLGGAALGTLVLDGIPAGLVTFPDAGPGAGVVVDTGCRVLDEFGLG
ncbi:MAG: hypothetical protein R2715_01165 [Ilumatobacteraceae bacterium]